MPASFESFPFLYSAPASGTCILPAGPTKQPSSLWQVSICFHNLIHKHRVPTSSQCTILHHTCCPSSSSLPKYAAQHLGHKLIVITSRPSLPLYFFNDFTRCPHFFRAWTDTTHMRHISDCVASVGCHSGCRVVQSATSGTTFFQLSAIAHLPHCMFLCWLFCPWDSPLRASSPVLLPCCVDLRELVSCLGPASINCLPSGPLTSWVLSAGLCQTSVLTP